MTKDPDVRYTQDQTCIARYTLAVDRRFKRENEQAADFINCVAFGKSGEFAEKYFRKGIKIAISGRIQTGSYTNRDGVKVFTTDIVVEEQEFCESKNASSQQTASVQKQPAATQAEIPDGFMSIPDGIDEELPFA